MIVLLTHLPRSDVGHTPGYEGSAVHGEAQASAPCYGERGQANGALGRLYGGRSVEARGGARGVGRERDNGKQDFRATIKG